MRAAAVQWAAVSGMTAGLLAVLDLRRQAGAFWHRTRGWCLLVVGLDIVSAAVMAGAGRALSSTNAVAGRGFGGAGAVVSTVAAAMVAGRLIPGRGAGDSANYLTLRRYGINEVAVVARAERAAYIVSVMVPASALLPDARLRHLVLELLAECERSSAATDADLIAARAEAVTADPTRLVSILVTYAGFFGARRLLPVSDLDTHRTPMNDAVSRDKEPPRVART